MLILLSHSTKADPLDGFITYCQLQATAAKDSEKPALLNLGAEISDMANICKGKSWVTDDPLGIGGLLGDAYRMVQLIANGDFEQTDLMETVLDSSLIGLKSYVTGNSLKLPVRYRLAFRELGLSIGLRAVDRLQELIVQNPGVFKKYPMYSRIESLIRYRPLSGIIETFWLERTNREAATWMAHRDINMVTLATSMAPDGYLTL